MSMQCPSCGKKIPDNSRFCPECGAGTVAPTPAAPKAVAPTPTKSPAQPSSVSAGSTAPASSTASTGAAPAGSKPNMKLIAGCGGAGCLFMLIVLVIAIVVIISVSSSKQPSGGGGGGGGQPIVSGGGGGGGGGPTQGGDRTAGGGALDGLISKQVGDFTLQKAQRMQDVIAKGAIDALNMEYRSNNGAQAIHMLIAMPQEKQADDLLEAFVQGFGQKGLTKKTGGDRMDRNNQKIGRYVVMGGQGTMILWTNGQVLATVHTPNEADALSFVKGAPY